MPNSTIFLIVITVLILGVVLITSCLIFMRVKKKKKLKEELLNLETEKNLVISAALLTELNKVESFANNDKIKSKIEKWKNEFNIIKEEKLPVLTDQFIEIEGLLETNKFNIVRNKLSDVELEIYYLKSESIVLLESIREITMSEERNRVAITKLKSLYREVINKYNKNKSDYKDISNFIELQFENIDKLFSAFEMSVDNHEFDELGKIVKANDDLIKNMQVVVQEAPTVIFMGKVVIPKKMNDIKNIAKKMTRDGYNLEYLQLEYNEEETTKKLEDIIDRLKVLNLEDSVFELKTMLDYYEGIYNDFEKERQGKKIYEKSIDSITIRIAKLSQVIKNIYSELSGLRISYDLTDEEVSVIDNINKELINIKDEFKLVSDRTQIKVNPYSKLANNCENVNVKLNAVEENLEDALRSLGSLKDDEIRAREELSEIKSIFKESVYKIKDYKLPVVPKKYYVEREEAEEAIKEIVKELDRKPISIKTLNTRVDTARDLTLKLYATAKETSKTAAMAEMAIVYGNRYRSTYKEVDAGIMKSEKEFVKGNYSLSLEIVLNTLNIVEPGIHKKLLSAYEE